MPGSGGEVGDDDVRRPTDDREVAAETGTEDERPPQRLGGEAAPNEPLNDRDAGGRVGDVNDRRRLRAAGFKAVETIRAGHPAETIVTHAIADRPDLIVLGTQRLSGLRRRVVGSVSGKVARYAPTSVLVARTAGPIRSVLLGYDASPDADEALELVARLPLHGGPQVTVCSAYDVVRPFSSGVAPTMVAEVRAAYSDSLRWAREAAEAMAASAGERLLERGVAATHRTARGPAHEQLAIATSELTADLLVVGSRGLSAIQRFFLGSTSATLVTQPPTSVLVARSIGGLR